MSKKIISLLLVLVMLVACFAACGKKNNGNNNNNNNNENNNGGNTTTFNPVASYVDPDLYNKVFNGGSVTTSKNTSAGGGTVSTTPYAGIAGKDYTDSKVYTYKDYLAGMTGLNWNPLTWETNDDSYVLGFLTMGLYDFTLNADLTGYSIVPEMAAAMPVDVTADYVGQYGIKEGETAKAWKIALNPNAKWQDGTAITSADYIYSMQQQLDPLGLYRRADSYYAGDFQLYNAKNYLYAGQIVYDLITDSVANLLAAGETVYIDMWNFWGLEGCKDADGKECPQYVSIADEVKYRDLAVEEGEDGDWISAKEIYEGYFAPGAPYESYASQYCYTQGTAPVVSWDEVGLLALDEYTIVYITVAPTEEASFYVPYNLSSNWIVNKALFEASKTYVDAEGNKLAYDGVNVPVGAVSVTTDYFTKLANTISYGPYKMTAFQDDKQIVFERNDNWYGYSDNKHLGQFQTDRIEVAVIKDDKTALQVFLSGDLAGKGLTSEYFETYASSDRLVYSPESYTTKLTFNSNYESLLALGNNQQMLSILEFRTAFALSVDKEFFASSYTSAGEAGFGLLNYQYCYDPFSGALYRDSEHAMKALVELFGLEYGEGKDFEDLEEAYNAITGYDLDAAKALMQAAYDKAVAAKIYDGKSPIVLEMTVYNSEDIYVKMVNYFNESIAAACEGTSLEGLVSITLREDDDYYRTMYAGKAAMIFSTWGGAAMSPFTMINQVYTDSSDGNGNQMEYGFESENIMVTINVDGKDITASLKNWADWCGSSKVASIEKELGLFTDYDYETRCAFFAIVEKVYLQGYATFGLYYRNAASLVSYKIEYATDSYLQLVGRGSIRDITYNYDDAEWESIKGNFSYTSSSAN